MTTTIATILDRWSSPEGHPYKGELIDWDAYDGDGEEPPANIGCMCAQGQVLHLMGGWSPQRLADAKQAEADLETAKLLGISISHAILLRSVNDSVDGAPGIVLTEPEKILGHNARGILAIWSHFDAMTEEQWWDAWAAWAARDARDAWAARDAWDAWAAWAAAFCAVTEMSGTKWLPEHEKGEFVFLPVFGFANPDEVIAAYPYSGPS